MWGNIMWGKIFAPIIDNALQDQINDLEERLEKQENIIKYLIETNRELIDAMDAICKVVGIHDPDDNSFEELKEKLPPRLQVVVDNDRSGSESSS
ncbi:MAG: hypothetical protein GXO10_04895 [Crenarchaeota archaeon]|nr:hypothetical protein [Thermoproteota archaeon]